MNRSLSSIIISKFLDLIESSTLSQIFSGFLAFLVSITVTVILTYTDDSIAVFTSILTWENAIIAKWVSTTIIVFNFSRILAYIITWFESIMLPPPGPQSVRTIDSIDGIPRIELLDHLFTVGSFKRDDVEKKWGIPRYRVTEISKKLEELGVLVRGENNARVLNTEYSRSDLASLLDGFDSVENIKILTRKTENGFSHKPSGLEIKKRVSTFITTPIRSAS